MSWDEYVGNARVLLERERELRGRAGSADAINALAAEQVKLVALAASRLPTGGPDVERICELLVNGTPLESDFVFAALRHQKTPPAVYLRALVISAASRGFKGEERARIAGFSFGEEAVSALLSELVEAGDVTPRVASFLETSASLGAQKAGRRIGRSP